MFQKSQVQVSSVLIMLTDLSAEFKGRVSRFAACSGMISVDFADAVDR